MPFYTINDSAGVRKSKNYPNFMCPKDKDLTLIGEYFSDTFEFLEIQLRPCRTDYGDVKCENIDEINRFFSEEGNEIQFIYTNTFLDPSDTENPIKTFIEDRFYFNIDIMHKKYANFFI